MAFRCSPKSGRRTRVKGYEQVQSSQASSRLESEKHPTYHNKEAPEEVVLDDYQREVAPEGRPPKDVPKSERNNIKYSTSL